VLLGSLEAGECDHAMFVIWNDLTDETAAELKKWREEEKKVQEASAVGRL
jgi:hypothetical protein